MTDDELIDVLGEIVDMLYDCVPPDEYSRLHTIELKLFEVRDRVRKERTVTIND